ncbi:MAG TPA: PEP-CTERM sorting domain-containing protein [Pyrinomonadaceae bacterium]
MIKLLTSLIVVLVSAGGARADVITFFDFNDSNLTSDRGQSANITTNFGATAFAAGSTVNADPDGAGPELASTAGQALNLVGSANNGNHIQFGVSTLSLASIQISFAAQRSSTGFNNNELLFSADGGTSFTSAGFFIPAATFGLLAFDLSGFAALDNQAEVIFRIVFNGASSSTGTNRIDNIAVTGTGAAEPVPEPVSVMMLGTGLASAAWSIRRRGKGVGRS